MPTYTRHAVVGYFADEASAQAAFDDLVAQGYAREQVHISTANDYSRSTDYDADAKANGTVMGERKVETHHGIGAWFRSLFGSDEYDEDAERYTNRAKTGGSVVAVETTDETREHAVSILNTHGATDVEEGSNGGLTNGGAGLNARGADYTEQGKDFNARGADFIAKGVESDTPRTQGSSGFGGRAATLENRNEDRTIPVIREEMEVGKRAVVSGGVRVFSRTVEEPVEEQVRLRQERAVVDRQPADREMTSADQTALKDQTIDVMEMSEEPVIQKRARVVEEVRVGKEATERIETVRDTLRHTEVQTEAIGARGANDAGSNYAADFERDFKTRYGSTGEDYRTYSPAYEYGYRMASDPRYTGKAWGDVESSVREDFGRRYPEGAWDRMKDAVRYGWDKVTGKR